MTMYEFIRLQATGPVVDRVLLKKAAWHELYKALPPGITQLQSQCVERMYLEGKLATHKRVFSHRAAPRRCGIETRLYSTTTASERGRCFGGQSCARNDSLGFEGIQVFVLGLPSIATGTH